jgi:hypothetical protein
MRVTEDTIHRLREVARRKSVSSPLSDLSWAAVGRELLEKALLAEERRAQPELLQLA